MTHFDRPAPWSAPQLRCRICNGVNTDKNRLVVERDRPAIAYHERCLHAEVGDELESIRRDLLGQLALMQDENPSDLLRAWDLTELTAVSTRLRVLEAEVSDRLKELKDLSGEAIRLWPGPSRRKAELRDRTLRARRTIRRGRR